VYEEEDVTVLWNQAVHRDGEVTANRSDIIIKNKKEKTCVLIDVATPAERNVKRKRKRSENTRLYVQRQRMWNLKYKIYP
jgi:hypothetical protein